MIIRPAKIEEITQWWENEIAKNPNDQSLIVWKARFIEENANGKRKTFFAFDESGTVIGQVTLLFESKDKLMTGDGKAELIKLEVAENHRGEGIATKIYLTAKSYARDQGVDTLTIGVEPSEIRNMQIYFHWGFTTFLQCITETFPSTNETDPGETVTVLCYSQKI